MSIRHLLDPAYHANGGPKNVIPGIEIHVVAPRPVSREQLDRVAEIMLGDKPPTS